MNSSYTSSLYATNTAKYSNEKMKNLESERGNLINMWLGIGVVHKLF